MNTDKLSEKLTVVIPALNEEERIGDLLMDLVQQVHARGIRVIVADGGSTDKTCKIVLEHAEIFKRELQIELIQGGTVSEGRNRGLDLVTTPYVVFIDADVELSSPEILAVTYNKLKRNWLVTARLSSRSGFPSNLVYWSFNVVMSFVSMWRPFAVGSYFATRTCVIRRKGGFREDVTHSEDWLLSGLYPKERFCRLNRYYKIIVDDRRFKRIGYWGMAVCMWKSLTQGESYMIRDNGYWK